MRIYYDASNMIIPYIAVFFTSDFYDIWIILLLDRQYPQPIILVVEQTAMPIYATDTFALGCSFSISFLDPTPAQ